MQKLILLLFFFVTSCALKPISPEITPLKIDINGDINNLGNGKVLFYNGANILHKMDNTARLNIWINNKALGQLRPREYVVLDLKNGDHKIDLLHIDVVKMRSKHVLTVNDTVKIVNIKPTLTSNKLTITNQFPKKFEKFEVIKDRTENN